MLSALPVGQMGNLRISVFLAVLVIGSISRVGDSLTLTSPELERINIDRYLRNRSLVEYHIRCLVYNGACDKIGKEIKKIWPIVAPTKCRMCSKKQKRKIGRIIYHIQRYYPRAWSDFIRRHPMG